MTQSGKPRDPKDENQDFQFDLGFDYAGGLENFDLPPPDLAPQTPIKPPAGRRRPPASTVDPLYAPPPPGPGTTGDGDSGLQEISPGKGGLPPIGEPLRRMSNRDFMEPDGGAVNPEELMAMGGGGEPEEHVDFNRVLAVLDIDPKRVATEGTEARLFCPIHKDQVRRSLVVHLDAGTFKCQFKSCPGHEGGGLVRLVEQALKISREAARARLFNTTGEVQAPSRGYVDRAQELIDRLDYGAALPLLKEAVDMNPGDEVTRCRLASLLLEMGDREAGMEQYMIAAEDYGVRGDLGKTLHIYKILVLVDPNDLGLHEQMAYIAARLGDNADAVSRLKWLVDQFIEQGQYEEAIRRADRLLEMTPGSVEFLLMKTDLLMAQGLSAKATELVAISVQEKVMKGELEDALRLANKGADLFPSNLLLTHLREEVSKELKKQGRDPERLTQEIRMLEEKQKSEATEDAGFFEWIAELEQDIQRHEEAKKTYAVTGEIPKLDERVIMCREQLKGFGSDKMQKMFEHLRQMYHDMKAAEEVGEVSEFEKKVIADFYRSFCIAFKEQNRENTGDSMLSRF